MNHTVPSNTDIIDLSLWLIERELVPPRLHALFITDASHFAEREKDENDNARDPSYLSARALRGLAF